MDDYVLLQWEEDDEEEYYCERKQDIHRHMFQVLRQCFGEMYDAANHYILREFGCKALDRMSSCKKIKNPVVQSVVYSDAFHQISFQVVPRSAGAYRLVNVQLTYDDPFVCCPTCIQLEWHDFSANEDKVKEQKKKVTSEEREDRDNDDILAAISNLFRAVPLHEAIKQLYLYI